MLTVNDRSLVFGGSETSCSLHFSDTLSHCLDSYSERRAVLESIVSPIPGYVSVSMPWTLCCNLTNYRIYPQAFIAQRTRLDFRQVTQAAAREVRFNIVSSL